MIFHQKSLHQYARLATRSEEGSAGYDLYAPEAGFLDPLSRKLIPLGFAAEFPKGYVALLLDRSGMGNKGITRFAGVIDSSWRGEWAVILYNSNPSVFEWKRGDRLIQVVFMKHEDCEPKWVDEISETVRGAKGFGSSGN